MTPNQLRNTLERRRAWLEARIPTRPEHQRSFDETEIAALSIVLRMVEPLTIGDAEEHRLTLARRREGFDARVAARATRCTCVDCPVHGKAAE